MSLKGFLINKASQYLCGRNFHVVDFENPNAVHVWAIDLDQLKISESDTQLMLSESEREKMTHFRFEKQRMRYVNSHFLFRILLGRYLGVDYYHKEFDKNHHGKPSLKNGEGYDTIYFNLSDSGNIWVCAFAKNCDVGVDIEWVHDLSEMQAIVEDFFSPMENRQFFSTPEHLRKETFFKFWTRKEALLKAMGVGLSFPLNQVDVLSGQCMTSEATIKVKGPSGETEWILHDINLLDGFASALAFESRYPDNPLQVQYFQIV
jgi:4'-phosphopantetheinyl transferase